MLQRAALPAALRLPGSVNNSRRTSHALVVRAYQAAAPTQRAIYANFAIYKGKAALSLRVRHSTRRTRSMPAVQGGSFLSIGVAHAAHATCMPAQVRKPRWVEMPDGSFSLDRPGSLMVELAPVLAGSGTNVGARSYSWDRKQVDALWHACCWKCGTAAETSCPLRA